MSVVGKYDAVVVHADNSALKFFRKFGFSDDVVLNSRWRLVAEFFLTFYCIHKFCLSQIIACFM